MRNLELWVRASGWPGTQWTRRKWFLHNYTLGSNNERKVLICEKLDFCSKQPIDYYFTAVQCGAVSFYRGWILQLAVCEWSPVVPSQLRVRADPLMSFRDWHICQIDKCVFSWKEVIICNPAQAPLEDACIFHLSYLLIQKSIIDQSFATLTEFDLLIGILNSYFFWKSHIAKMLKTEFCWVRAILK